MADRRFRFELNRLFRPFPTTTSLSKRKSQKSQKKRLTTIIVCGILTTIIVDGTHEAARAS